MKTWTRPELKRMDVTAVTLVVHCDTTLTKYECGTHNGNVITCEKQDICCWDS